eukprot:177381-Chlamydomonas_euryale.AAC.8
MSPHMMLLLLAMCRCPRCLHRRRPPPPHRCVVDEERGQFSANPALKFKHDYPPTKLMFMPDKEGSQPDLLASTGEYLRIWRVHDDNVRLELLLNNVRKRWCRSRALGGGDCTGVEEEQEAARRARLEGM